MTTMNQTSRGDRGIKKSQLKKLVDNYYEVMHKKGKDGNVVPLDREKDAKSVWFTKAAIDQLFADHGCTADNNDEFGLRIYFTVHKLGILHPEHEIPENYDNQQGVVLVATKNINGQKDRDLLKNDEDLIKGTDGKGDGDPIDGEGTGTNHGASCPPETDCGCLI